jgi:hypothetical protein
MTSPPSPQRAPLRHELAAALLLGLLLLLAYALYRPGLTGAFQFDDHSNLHPLETLAGNPTPDQLGQYLLKGISSPIGRPVSLLTFAAQAHSWPTDPASFIRANILLHLLNGVLLFWWLQRLVRLAGTAAPAGSFVALGATALWLVAPIQATSVLYVVQRMTELSATFVFLGMGLYLVGREALERGARNTALAWMSAGLCVGAGVGTLAKENAAQMPLMVLALEFTLLARCARPRPWTLWAVPFLGVPAVALLAYLAWIGATGSGFYGRDFTPVERLLTEPRVLFMYVHKMLMPWPSAMRLWYDDFHASRDLFTPWTTVLALAALAAAVGAAWKLRRAAPPLAFAVLWFLACHVLESSALPLELVFEHRNYQASVGIWLALAMGAHRVLAGASSITARNVFAALAGVYLALHAVVTWQVASLWGRPLELAAWMAARLPDSQRASLSFVITLMHRQLPFDAALQAERGSRRWPGDPSFQLLAASLACQIEQIPFPDAADMVRRAGTVSGNVNAVVDHLDNLVSLMETGHCPVGLPFPISDLTGAALANPALGKQGQNLLLLHSRALELEQRGAEARETFGRAIDLRPQMILLIQGILDAVAAGDLDLARRYLARAHSDPRIGARDRWSHRNDIPLLEELVRSREAAARDASAEPRGDERFQ